MKRVTSGWTSVCGLVALAVASSSAWLGGAAAPAPQSVLAVAERANSNPSIAAAGAFVAVTWVVGGENGSADVYLAASTDAGQTFASPVRVSGSTGADVSGEQPPRVVLSPRTGRVPAIRVVWTAKAVSGTRLLSARSDDGGRRFSPPSPLAGSDAPGNRGWESIAVTPDGDAFAVWLDHRELANGAGTMNHAAHQHGAGAEDGAARAQRSKLMFGAVDGGGAAREVAAGVCYCCKTSLAAAAGGRFYAAWRHVYPGNLRDIAFTMSTDGGRTFAAPVRVSEDHWMLDGCPENGPALSVDARQRIHVVWPTLVSSRNASSQEPELALFYAMSSDGHRFTARERIPSEPGARHPQLAIDESGAFVVVWDEPAGGRRRIAVARGTVENGVASFARQTIDDPDSATYPVVAFTNRGPLVAWSSRSIVAPPVIRLARF
jgi:hypothetical protein